MILNVTPHSSALKWIRLVSLVQGNSDYELKYVPSKSKPFRLHYVERNHKVRSRPSYAFRTSAQLRRFFNPYYASICPGEA